MRRSWEATVTGWTTITLGISSGLTALILGEGASKAFSNLGGSLSIRVMGIFLLAGGLSLLWAWIRTDLFWQSLACVFLGTGAMIYAVGVVLGLHNQGLMSGQFSLMLASLFWVQVLGVLRTVRRRDVSP